MYVPLRIYVTRFAPLEIAVTGAFTELADAFSGRIAPDEQCGIAIADAFRVLLWAATELRKMPVAP
jgi:hypothetical protein